MAEGLLRARAQGRFEVESAGSKPSLVRPEAIAVMDELGIDLRTHRSKHVDEFSGQHFDVVITVCDNARDVCPVFPAGTTMLHWSFEDPASVEGSEAERIAEFRKTRDLIAARIDERLK